MSNDTRWEVHGGDTGFTISSGGAMVLRISGAEAQAFYNAVRGECDRLGMVWADRTPELVALVCQIREALGEVCAGRDDIVAIVQDLSKKRIWAEHNFAQRERLRVTFVAAVDAEKRRRAAEADVHDFQRRHHAMLTMAGVLTDIESVQERPAKSARHLTPEERSVLDYVKHNTARRA